MGELRPVVSKLAATAARRAALTGAAATMPTASAALPEAPFAAHGLKILHILRAPLGGLFRHVCDVAAGQAERGHRVGLIVDSMTGGARAEAALAELTPCLALGLQRLAIPRQLGLRDIDALRGVGRRIKVLAPDVLHGHGAKGGALARLVPGAKNAIRVYTPHGGSLVYAPGTLGGGFYRALEWLMIWRTDLFLFESSYIAEMFRSRIGRPRALGRIVRNGVGDADFAPLATQPDATDIVCVGELRAVKAIDVLIAALAALNRGGRAVSATIAGDGPDGAALKADGERFGLAKRIRFVGYRPAREAFAMGRMLVIPSRAESLPYVVLEAAAAGMPILATKVGGIPEIFGPQAGCLIAPDDAAALARAIGSALDNPAQMRRSAQALKARVLNEFSVSAMVDGGLAAYREAIAMRKLAQFA
jgi:glycosyltransferase involved in cell wall biosynthesis